MDQNRWKKINDIFHATLDVAATEREQFIMRLADGDVEVAEEVKLLLKADQDAGSYIETPAVGPEAIRTILQVPSPAVLPGDLLCGRFRIARNVGEGGMGQVFEAVDTELGVQVALKVIRPDIAHNPQALARFRQEVRLARKITHPNVCRTFDLERETRSELSDGVTQEILFLTMEFLEGETLACRLSREGPLPLGEALEIARQVASGLESARALGVVHRDIKPGNVMLVNCREGIRAVITDFGLARVDAADLSRSSAGISDRGNPIGTLAYMAPEQLENGAITSATDVYAFGLLLFEMVTGKRAFPSETLLSGIAQRLSGNTPHARTIVPDLPESWSGAIEGCLSVKPEDRFAGASDVIAVLDGARTAPSLKSAGSAKRRGLRAWLSARRLIAATTVAAVSVSLFWAGLRLSGLKGDPHVTPGALVYLAPVKNETGEKALDNMTELIRAGLAQSAHINLLDQSRVGDMLQRMNRPPDTAIDEPIAREIAMRTGAVRVVFATVRGKAGKYQLDMDVQQSDNTPERARNHWPRSFAWQSDANSNGGSIPQPLLNAVRDASDWTRLQVGESVNDIARLNVPPEDVTTGNWEALADFVQAEQLARQDRRDEAVSLLERTVGADPQFALAFARLGDLLFSLNRITEGYQAYSRALSDDLSHRLSRRERDLVKGMFAVDSRDFPAAEEAFRDCSIYYESDKLCRFFRAYPLRMMGRPTDSTAILARLTSDPEYTLGAFTGIAYDQILIGGLGKALESAKSLKDAGAPDRANLLKGQIAFLKHDYGGSQDDFESLKGRTVNEDLGMGYAMLARLHAELGDNHKAFDDLEAAIEADHSVHDKINEAARLLDRAHLHARLGEVEPALKDLDDSMALDSSPTAIIQASAELGWMVSSSGDSSRAVLKRHLQVLQTKLPKLESACVFELARRRVQGEVLLAEGKTDQAMVQFEAADVLDAPITGREYLARALAAAARTAYEPARAAALRNKALAMYERVALAPQSVWFYAVWFPPGFVKDEVRDALSVAKAAGDRRQAYLLGSTHAGLQFGSN
jgi:eukaryotic-like serine/threonine-protein kinase